MKLRVYLDFRDWWIGYYRGDDHHYFCPFFTVVIRWNRKSKINPKTDYGLFQFPIIESSAVPDNKIYVLSDPAATAEMLEKIKSYQKEKTQGFTRIADKYFAVNPELLDRLEELS